MPKTTLENVGRRRLTPKGSRAPNELELDIPDLKPGEGQLLPSGEIVLHDPKKGVIVLRADNAYAYIPKVKTANPLDELVSGSSEDDGDDDGDSPENPPAEKTSTLPDPGESKEDEPAIPSSELDKHKPLIGRDGQSVQATSGKGYGQSSF